MIRYNLRCPEGHDFEGWFRSSAAFDAQRAAGQVACTICGSTQVDKALMAPMVPKPNEAAPAPAPADLDAAIARIRAHVEANSDYVGNRFAAEARAMHAGERPSRAIHGEARPEDARALIEDGVPIAPLPFRPRQKSN